MPLYLPEGLHACAHGQSHPPWGQFLNEGLATAELEWFCYKDVQLKADVS